MTGGASASSPSWHLGPAPHRRSTTSAIHLRPRLASYKAPKKVVLVTSIERSPSGKADYRWAKALAATSSATP